MGERLQYSVAAQAGSEQLPLPPALVMTLVENAIKHGIEPAAEGGRVDVRSVIDGQQLVISVADTGVGLAPTQPNAGETGTGLGLSNIAQRLQAIYGDAARLQLTQNTPAAVLLRSRYR